MNRSRSLLALAVVVAAASFPVGCAPVDPDRTGDPDGGIGAAGTNDPDAPKTQEEARKRQVEEEAAFRKKGHRSAGRAASARRPAAPFHVLNHSS